MTQKEMVLQYMQDFGSITSLEAFRDLGITRLSGRIFELREAGYDISMTMESSRNRYGKAVSYGRYSIE